MELVSNHRSYIESVIKIIQDMKVLLLDDETTRMVSLVYTQTELLQHDVVLIESLKKRSMQPVDEALNILNCVCILRPTHANINDLKNELHQPHFNQYNILFTNAIDDKSLSELALADHESRVTVVHEIYIDVCAINKRLFSLGLQRSLYPVEADKNDAVIKRISDGLFSLICAFKLKASIRFDSGSNACRIIADALQRQVNSNEDFIRQNANTAQIIILDRRRDPLPPILHSWSYQSMLHEIIGINYNIATLQTNPPTSIVLDERTDEFFAQNLFTGFGELGDAIKNLTQTVREQPTNVKDIKSLDELKQYIQSYPILHERQQLASKHANLSGEISKAIKNDDLLNLALLEQSIVADNDPTGHLDKVLNGISIARSNQNALRLALLYVLKYNGADETNIKAALNGRQHGEQLIKCIDQFNVFANERYERKEPLFQKKSIISKARNLIGFNRDNEDQFSQYVPNLESIVVSLEKKALDIKQFPEIKHTNITNPSKTIIFFVGGTTYEEGRIVAQASKNGMDIILGGTTIHNMNSFVKHEIQLQE